MHALAMGSASAHIRGDQTTLIHGDGAIQTVAGSKSHSKPNFILVLADDLESDFKQDRHAVMPNLKKMLADGGLKFSNHAAVSPLCGPSRAAMLTSLYPHNNGYMYNRDDEATSSFKDKHQDDTIGAWMTKAGYYTAFIGKYLNGMYCEVPRGWNHWGGLTCKHRKNSKGEKERYGGVYSYYNASQYDASFDAHGQPRGELEIKIHNGVHQAPR